MKIEIVRRHELGPRGWNLAVDAVPMGWWWHREEWVEYSREYAPGSEDRSFVVALDGDIALLAPLVVKDRRIQTGGQSHGAAPLFLFEDGADRDVVMAVAKAASDEANRLADDAGRIALRPMTALRGVAPPPPGMVRVDRLTLVAELADDDTMLAKFRKSYRQGVRRASKHYTVNVFDSADAVEAAKALHLAEAGRATRSDATWRMMAEWCETGHGMVALAHNYGGAPVGFAYAISYKKWAYYASGAVTVRDDMVGPALQFALMRGLRDDGIQFYELGPVAEASGDDAKARGIAFFKSGFGARPWPVATLNYAAPVAAAPRGGVRRSM